MSRNGFSKQIKMIRSFLTIVDAQTIVISVLTVFATYLCGRFGFYADLPTGLIAIAIVFPIVFTINSAYKRREEALKYFASLKAHAIALFFAHRDWVKDDPSHAARARDLTEKLLKRIREYLVSSDNRDNKLIAIYSVISDFSLSHEMLRNANVQATEISRANQYLRTVIVDFERMRNISLYRTPIPLRAYCQIFLNLFPILFAPYFANICHETYSLLGYGLALLYSVVLVSLDNIQEDLEDPYDGIGEDDVNLNVEEEYVRLMKNG